MVSVRRGFLFLLVLGIGCVIFNFCGYFYTKPVVIILHQMRESEVSTSPVVSLEADGHLWNTVSGLKTNFFGLGVQTTKKMNI